jgi:hypothetical protein
MQSFVQSAWLRAAAAGGLRRRVARRVRPRRSSHSKTRITT